MSEHVERIARQLNVPSAKLAALDHLDDAEQLTFATCVEEAIARQTREISRSLEAALAIVPRPLRGRARKLLFPGGRDG